MRFRSKVAARLKDDRGFTLTELLVTMASAIVVTGSLFAIQQIALFESGRVFARVDATQQARLVMGNIGSRLQSSCVADGVAPIKAASTGNTLRVVSKYGSAATLIPELHVISRVPDPPNPTMKLVDQTFPRTGGTSPEWTFSPTPSSTRTMVTGVDPSGAVFEYLPYGIARDGAGNAYLDSAGNPYVMLLDGTSSLPNGVTTSAGAPADGIIPANSPSPLPATGTGLSAANAKIASAVRVTLGISPGGQGENPRYDKPTLTEDTTFTNTFSLRLTPPLSDRNPQLVTACG